jgi:hypothetical protein
MKRWCIARSTHPANARIPCTDTVSTRGPSRSSGTVLAIAAWQHAFWFCTNHRLLPSSVGKKGPPGISRAAEQSQHHPKTTLASSIVNAQAKELKIFQPTQTSRKRLHDHTHPFLPVAFGKIQRQDTSLAALRYHFLVSSLVHGSWMRRGRWPDLTT